MYAYGGLTFAPVIKLKQVEHVRNERKTLSAVAGHPFITTLIASFSDDQSLYMVVRAPNPFCCISVFRCPDTAHGFFVFDSSTYTSM
jgi:serine/threonine protein kinase